MRPPLRRSATAGRAAWLAGALAASALLLPASAGAQPVISSNWAGYVAGDGRHGFRRVSASWIVPAATCTAGHETHSAVWVGLGGYRAGATALEQIGTDADCTAHGRASYSSWVELLPAASRTLTVRVHPGDEVAASVTIVRHRATLRLSNLTTGRGHSTVRRLTKLDVSTADWVVEAPASCDGAGRCRTLDLTDFGAVAFTAATAGTGARTAELDAWPSTELLLRQSAAGGSGATATSGVAVTATPSAAAAGAFTVTFGESAATGAPEGPTLPGASAEAAAG